MRDRAILQRREPFFERGSRSSKEGAVLQRREPFFKGGKEVAVHWGTKPFCERGRTKDEGRCSSREEGHHSSMREGGPCSSSEGRCCLSWEGVCCLPRKGHSSSTREGGNWTGWWEGRTRNFHVGKFKVQHK